MCMLKEQDMKIHGHFYFLLFAEQGRQLMWCVQTMLSTKIGAMAAFALSYITNVTHYNERRQDCPPTGKTPAHYSSKF